MRVRFPPFMALLIIGTGCLTDSITYSPDKDDDAMAVIASRWTSPSGLTLSLCEDVSAPEQGGGCDVEHVVRGGGRGRSHEEERGIGCGGCPSRNLAVVNGFISGGGLSGTVMVKGEVTLGGLGDENPYEFPYNVSFTCVGQPCSFQGTLEEDGSLELTSYDSTTATSVITALTVVGPASCP